MKLSDGKSGSSLSGSLSERKEGLKSGIPIALGYLSVSFSFGIMAAQKGIPGWAVILISMTNVTSAGQVAGVLILAAGGGYLELILSMLVINLRYALMSVTLSQKLHSSIKRWHIFLMSFCVTDEIFAVAAERTKQIRFPFFLGLMTLPYLGWLLGTVIGVLIGNVLPALLTAVLGLMIYGMFLAIVLPVAKAQKSVAIVVLISVILSCVFYYVPGLNALPSGITIILCAVAASLYGAWRHPVHPKEADAS